MRSNDYWSIFVIHFELAVITRQWLRMVNINNNGKYNGIEIMGNDNHYIAITNHC